MNFPAELAKNRYVRDYQVVELEGSPDLSQGQINTYNFNFPFRFIAEELVCQVFFAEQEILINQTYTTVPEPPILTQIKYHSSFLDNQPIALRSAWGTAQRPAKLPIPWAVEQGTNISVEAQIVPLPGGPIISANLFLRPVFSIRGYQPSDAEFNEIKNRNDEIAVRPYQTFTFQQRNGLTFIAGKDPGFAWDAGPEVQFDIDFPMDIFVVKNVAEVFDVENVDVLMMSNPPNVPEPEISLKLITKSANLFSTTDVFRNIFGTGKFPTMLNPNMQFKQGDFARITLRNNRRAQLGVYMSLIGYAPKPSTIRRGDIQRGRVKPEQYDPQPMIGGRVK